MSRSLCRSPRHFSISAPQIATQLQTILTDQDDTRVVTEEGDLQRFNTDWTGQFPGKSQVAVQPATTSGVSKVLAFCNAQGIGVVPQGGENWFDSIRLGSMFMYVSELGEQGILGLLGVERVLTPLRSCCPCRE